MNQKWTSYELEYIRNHAGTTIDKDLAEQLSAISGREISESAVRKKRQKLGLKKNHGRGKCSLVKDNNNDLAFEGLGIRRPNAKL